MADLNVPEPLNPVSADAAGQRRKGKRLTAKGEQTRAVILDAAERQFAERGFEGVTLRQVMTEAGVQMGQMQYYFANKEAVFASVLERRLAEICQDYGDALEALEQHELDGEEGLREVIRAVVAPSRAWLTSSDTGKHRYLRMLALSTTSFDQPDYVKRHGEAFRPLNERTQVALARCFEETPEPSIKAAYIIIEANLLSMYINIEGMLRRSGLSRSPETVGALYDDLEAFLLGGVKALVRR